MVDLTSLINAAIPYVVTGVSGFLVYEIKKVVPSAVKLLIAKAGFANYGKLKTVAADIFSAIEEDARLGNLADTKINTFEAMIKQQFPSITDAEINLVRQAIAGEVNKCKEAVKETEQQTIQQITVTPVTKYVAPDGTELTPLISPSIVTDQVNTAATNIQAK